MSRTAKYYVYPIKGGQFKVRYKGKVIATEDSLLLMGVEFRVNEKGRQKVIEKGKYHTHAFLVCDNYLIDNGRVACAFGKYEVPVTYSPLNHPKFFRVDTGKDVDNAIICHCKEGLAFIR